MTVYGSASADPLNPNQQALYDKVAGSAQNLRDQLRELKQLGHVSAQPGDIAAVQAALFRAHGYQRDGGR